MVKPSKQIISNYQSHLASLTNLKIIQIGNYLKIIKLITLTPTLGFIKGIQFEMRNHRIIKLLIINSWYAKWLVLTFKCLFFKVHFCYQNYQNCQINLQFYDLMDHIDPCKTIFFLFFMLDDQDSISVNTKITKLPITLWKSNLLN